MSVGELELKLKFLIPLNKKQKQTLFILSSKIQLIELNKNFLKN